MTHPSLRAHWSFASALLSVAMTVALAAFTAAPGGVSTVQAQACSPQIGIDAPAPGDTVSGSVTFSGWAVDLTSPGGSGVDQVRLYRDAPPEQGGTPLAVATVGIDRPDIDAANSLTGSMAGWTASVDFTDSPAGSSTVYIYAHTICGWTYATQVVSIDSSNVAAPPAPAQAAPAIQIFMDTPTAGAMVNNGQALNVSGWAVDASGAGTGVDTVRLFLDGPEGTGQPLGWANYGRSRPDVVSTSGNPAWDKSGFDLVWPIAGISAGSHVLYVYAHSTATGQWDYTTVPITVTSAGAGVPGAAATTATAPSNPNAVVRVEAPTGNAPITGPTVVRGYAVDCTTGNPATTIRYYAGNSTAGRLLGTVTVGTGSRDLTAICAGRGLTGSSNASFNFTVDPQSLGGSQSITIAADTVAGTGTATLAFGGSATTAGTGTTGTTGACTAAAALSPFTVSCGSSTGTTSMTGATTANPNAAPNPSATSSSYTACAPNYQTNNTGNPYYTGNNQNYMSAVQGSSPGCASTANSNYTACNPNYPQSNPNYPNNIPCTSTSSAQYGAQYNPNTAYNSGNYNAYTSYNGVNYPSTQYTGNQQYGNPYYNNTQTLSGYQYNNNAYPYNNTNPYYSSTTNNYPYTNSYNQYGNPYNTYNYNNNNAYGYPYSGYNNNTAYSGYPYGYGGNGAYGLPQGYAPNYVYNGNAGANYNPYGSGYGYNNYGYNNYGQNPYGNPYGNACGQYPFVC
jgi:hypothetical protein